MAYVLTEADAKHWDWLPEAAREVESYLKWLMAEESVRVHEVSARAKSIASLLSKIRMKEIPTEDQGEAPKDEDVTADARPTASPGRNSSTLPTQLDDVIAARVIVYSERDRNRAIELIRDRFSVLPNEDKNPGLGRPVGLMGYDSWHFVVDGLESPSDLVGDKSNLSVFFTKFHGLEIQIRTVAAHAWAEFEHTHRYKSLTYASLAQEDRDRVDDILRDAHAYRKQLDQALNDAMSLLDQAAPAESFVDSDETGDESNTGSSQTDRSEDSENADFGTTELTTMLATRYPGAAQPSERGAEFGLGLVRALGITSISSLESHLDEVKSHRVSALLHTEEKATTVRRLDDDLLALFGTEYIEATLDLGESPFRERRPDQLAWRWSLIKPKSTKRNVYAILGTDAPEPQRAEMRSAAGAIRDLVEIIGTKLSVGALSDDRLSDVVSVDRALSRTARARRLEIDGHTVWVHSNFRVEYAERVMELLLEIAAPLDLQVTRSGEPMSPPSAPQEQAAEGSDD